MSSDVETFRLGLFALLSGIAIPLLVQLFLVLRSVQRVANVLDRRLDRTLGDLEAVTASLKRASTPAPSWPAVVAAAVPAVLAAAHAFRSSVAASDEAPPPSTSSNNHAQEKRS